MSESPKARAPRRRNGGTATANFGSGKREGHDASAFYKRFVAPEVSGDETINPPDETDVIYCADARHMTGVPDNSVALVVTSPPYFAGKQYEEELGVDGVPSDYFEYLELLNDVFAECKRVLEPGGRIAVNIANLGRRPYRSLSADVTTILSDLGLLLRGEVIWWKGKAAGGSCAWGSFQSPANPVLRDVTERVVIASKGRFDRAFTARQRADRGLPSTVTISRDEFMEATTDMWEIAPESATKIGHPAPFPVALPRRLIDLYTYEGDTVLDPFMGSGSTAVAAIQTGRHYIGFDLDPDYITIAQDRITQGIELVASGQPSSAADGVHVRPLDSSSESQPVAENPLELALREGRQIKDTAEALLVTCGFTNIRRSVKPRGLGIEVSFVASDRTGMDWAFDLSGTLTSTRNGLRRSDTLWRVLAKAAILHQDGGRSLTQPDQHTATVSGRGSVLPLVLLSTDVPAPGTAGHRSLSVMRGLNKPVADVIDMFDPVDIERLALIGSGGQGVDGTASDQPDKSA